LPKQFVTIDEKRVAVSDITSKEKPFPFSTIYHDEGISMLENDMQYYQRTIQAFEKMIEMNPQKTDFAERTRQYARENIRQTNNVITSKLMEVQYRKEMCKKHKLRFGAN
jgi:hypothetical protein